MDWGEDSNDEALMEAYRDGAAGAFDILYGRHRGGLYRYLLRQCPSRGEAEELFQDVWMNLIRARAGYRVEAKFTTYLYRIAHNRLIDRYRRAKDDLRVEPQPDDGEDPIDALPAAPASDPARQVDARRQLQRLAELLAALPDSQREAFLLQEEGGMSVEQIAQATGVNRETAKSRLRYAMNRLRQGMRGWLE